MTIDKQSEIPSGVRADVADALYRFAAGQDFKDPALFETAFSSLAVLDFSHPARRLGLELPPFEGRRAIADAVIGATADLTTTHTITNVRFIAYGDARAAVTALIEAQHLPVDADGRNLLLKHKLSVELIVEDGLWVIDRMHFQNLWKEGDAAVLFPAAAQQAAA